MKNQISPLLFLPTLYSTYIQDSLIFSLSRERNGFENVEKDKLLTTGSRIPYDQSLVSKNLAHSFIRALHQIFDFSSLGRDTVISKLIREERPINAFLLEVLSILRKNSPLYFKEELLCHNLQAFFGLSPKQYSLVTFDLDLNIPSVPQSITPPVYSPHEICSPECDSNLLTHSNRNHVLRVKGIKRSIQQKVLTPALFQKSAERFCTPKKIVQHSLIRRDRRIFLVSQTRKSFSRFCNKQYFHTKFATRNHQFSFPLYLKGLIELNCTRPIS